MQEPFSCIKDTLDAIEATISPARLKRYIPTAKGDPQFALRLYLWNVRICEAFYFPLQTAEIATRNAIKKPIEKRFGDRWFDNPKFINLLDDHKKEELRKTVEKESNKRSTTSIDQNHITGGLSFGFWVNLMTTRFSNHLWVNGIFQSFPHANKDDTQESIYNKIEQMRRFRNQVMHHYAVFDKPIRNEYQNTLDICAMICPETHWYLKINTQAGRIIESRPKC